MSHYDSDLRYRKMSKLGCHARVGLRTTTVPPNFFLTRSNVIFIFPLQILICAYELVQNDFEKIGHSIDLHNTTT